MVFGPDRKLYISAGDGGRNPNLAQDLTALNGKILRINADGTVPADNPFTNRPGVRPEIWAYGLRNPWRFAFAPLTGLMIIGDVGQDLYEEMNFGRPGANYGWPQAEGPPSSIPMLTNPVYAYDHIAGGAAIVVGTFYTGTKFPSKYQNALFLSDYSRDFIKTARFDSSGNLTSVNDFAVNLNTPVHLLQDRDGALLYVSFSNGEIRRIRYVGGKNQQPVAVARASARFGPVPLTIKFKSNGSYDPDDHPLTYFWDFGDGVTSNLANPTHTFGKKGTLFALLTVRDSKGSTAYARSIRITAGNLAPTATILTPADGTKVRPGQNVSFSGEVIDLEDSTIPPEKMFWSAQLHHNDHTHPAFSGRGASGTFPIPSVLHDSGDYFFRLQLRVTDSKGVADSDTVDVILEK